MASILSAPHARCRPNHVTLDRLSLEMPGPLSTDAVNAFLHDGYCTLQHAFSADAATRARAIVWNAMEREAGIREADPSSWPAAYVVEKYLKHPALAHCFTDRLAEAIEQLLGPHRWCGVRRWGFWSINFSYGADAKARWPKSGWHTDGNWFRHTLDCHRQGLLILGLFSEVKNGWGGSVVSAGSHRRVARILAANPDGLDHGELFKQALASPLGRFAEITGDPGDVILAHPFLLHCRGFKFEGPPRFITNVEAPLLSPLDLRDYEGRSPSILERSIMQAIVHAGVESISEDAQWCTT